MTSHRRLLSLILPDRTTRRRRLLPSTYRQSEGPATVTVDILPDDVLLHIFRFDRVTYLEGADRLRPFWRWHRLAHVSRRWRSIVFTSPNFLNLSLVCGPMTYMKLTGSIWPPLPIIIRNTVDWPMPEDYDFDAAIVHHDRVCEINLHSLKSSQLQRLALAMQNQFPALIRLVLSGYHSYPAPALPDKFLDGSAPHLQSLTLLHIAFPALPKLLLSATDLVYLTLWEIPHSGYISPEAIVTGLAVLVNLESLTIEFESPLSCPDRKRRPPQPPTRAVLPALTRFEFKGVSEYLEELVIRMDTPLLDSIRITFFLQLIFDISQLAQFVRRMTRPRAFNEAHVDFSYYGIQVWYIQPTRTFDERSGLGVSCTQLDWQLSSVTQVITSFFPFIHMVEHLYIYGPPYLLPRWQDGLEDVQWLEIFRLFTAVENLYICKEFVPIISRALAALQKLVGRRMTEVLPTLQNIFLETLEPSGLLQEDIGKFVTLRQLLSGYPIAVSRWERGAAARTPVTL